MSELQKNIVNDCKIFLSSILDKSGGILYSSCDTLKKGKFYVLGLNPGGNYGPTIRDSLNVIFSSKENAYLDEDWSTEKRKYGVGGHPLQKNLKYLFDFLGYDLRHICSSNLIFVRSPNQDGFDFIYYANLCWKVHQLILGIINPSVIIVFGNSKISPYSFITNLHKKNTNDNILEINFPSNHGNWFCRSFRTNLFGNETLILGLPHLSRYRIYDNNNDRKAVLDWIKNRITSVL